jgi:hypothetical protein
MAFRDDFAAPVRSPSHVLCGDDEGDDGKAAGGEADVLFGV